MPTATVLQNKTTYFGSCLKIVLRTVRWSSGRATRGLDHSLAWKSPKHKPYGQ